MTNSDLVALLESIAHSAARQGHGGGWCVAECLMCAELPKIDAALTALKSGAVVLVPGGFQEFIADMFRLSDWPDGGDIDGFSFQDTAVARGLLVPETRTEPCGEGCHCAEFHGDMSEGVTCYRYSPELRAMLACCAKGKNAKGKKCGG